MLGVDPYVWRGAGVSMIGKIISHYRIVEKLGEGGMGEVYKAEDLRLRGRVVAIKILSPGLLDEHDARLRIEREAEAIGRLDHSNIAVLHEFDQFEDRPFLCMQYIDGGDLSQKITSDGLPIQEVTRLGIEIAESLGYIHDQGIIHRDLKPSNIMITSNGQVKLTDFGLAKIEVEPAITRQAALIGTACYMAPEMIRGDAVDHRSDLFSFGIVLFEMITGRPPFTGDSLSTIVYKIVNEEVPRIPMIRGDASPGLASIVTELLKKAPEERIQDAGEVARRLQDVTVSHEHTLEIDRRSIRRRGEKNRMRRRRSMGRGSLILLPFLK